LLCEGAGHKLIKLSTVQPQLMSHIRTVRVVYFYLATTDYSENIGFFAVVEEKEVVVIPAFLFAFSESLHRKCVF
jgi:hypothetical protein